MPSIRKWPVQVRTGFRNVQDYKATETKREASYHGTHCITLQKKKATDLLGLEGDNGISDYEWRQAKMHAKYPGALKPVEVIKCGSSNFGLDAVGNFLGWLDDHYIQNHAYGDKNVEMTTGKRLQLDGVSTTASCSHIIKDYNKQFSSEAHLPAEGQCKVRSKATGFPCILKENHEGRHKYTSKDMLSPSSIQKIVGTLAKGQRKTKAGLDDEDVLKGSRSIERLVEIYSILAIALNHGKERRRETEKQILWVLEYHRTNFISHLSKNAKKRC